MPVLMQNARRRNALLLSLLLTFMLLFSVGVMFVEVGHHCGGFNCDVCAGILSLRAILTHAGTLLLLALMLRWLGRLPRPALFTRAVNRVQSTPVSLAIRMND